MRIAILGTRGIPANYGGFETFAEQLSVRLADRGHDVTVYCRRGNHPEPINDYRGVRLVTLGHIRTKTLDTLSHTLLSTLHSLGSGPDIAYFCNVANSCFTWITRLRGAKTIVNTDGLEWERAKWNWAGKAFFRFSEYLAALFPHLLVSDSRVIQAYYKNKFNVDSAFVAYGADLLERGTGADRLAALGVEPERYLLYVSRLEPENNAHLVVQAFERVVTPMKLLIVGSAPYADEYIRKLKSTKDERILFPGGLYGEMYDALRANAYLYVNAMEVGGTHPAILEAMGAGNCVLVSDIEYNEEAISSAGVTFRNKDVDDMAEKMQWIVDHPEEAAAYGREAKARVAAEYNWERVTDEYERIFQQLLAA